MKRSAVESQAMGLFDVHAYIEVRAKVTGIRATSMLAAARMADEVDLGGALAGEEFQFDNFKVYEVVWAGDAANAFTVDPLVDGHVDFSRTRTVTPDAEGGLDLPGDEGGVESYVVHVFTNVRVAFAAIEASSPEAAARKIGGGDFDLHDLLRRGRYPMGDLEIAEVEYTEGAPTGYVVDPIVNGEVDRANSVELDESYQRVQVALENVQALQAGLLANAANAEGALGAARVIAEDVARLACGEWVPDEDSCAAIAEQVDRLKAFVDGCTGNLEAPAEVKAAVQCLAQDFEMLASGEWQPDEDSCDASLQQLDVVRNFIELNCREPEVGLCPEPGMGW